jgi:hypothetical protein
LSVPNLISNNNRVFIKLPCPFQVSLI